MKTRLVLFTVSFLVIVRLQDSYTCTYCEKTEDTMQIDSGSKENVTIEREENKTIQFSTLHLYGISQCELSMQSAKYLWLWRKSVYVQSDNLPLLSGYRGQPVLLFKNVSVSKLLNLLTIQIDCENHCYCTELLCVDLTATYIVFTTEKSLVSIRKHLDPSLKDKWNRLENTILMSVNPLIGYRELPFQDMRTTYELSEVFSSKETLNIVRKRIRVRVEQFLHGRLEGSQFSEGQSYHLSASGREIKPIDYCNDYIHSD